MAGGFVPVPDWFGWENQDCGLAVADVDGDGRPDVVVLVVDNPPGQNAGLYRIGHQLAGDGTVGSWDPWIAVPDWFGWENQGAGVAVADVDGDGELDLVVFVVDNPPEQNAGYYRVGHRLAADGTVSGWGPWIAIPDWFGWENQGADIAITHLDGQPALVVVVVDAPAGQNTAYYRLGRGLAPDGTVTGGWTPWVAVPDWGYWENQGVGVAAADLDSDGRPELIVFALDNPVAENAGYYTVGWGLDSSGHAVDGWGVWSKVDGWGFWENQGAALAVLEGAQPELVVLAVDNPPGQNAGYVRVVDLDTDLDMAHEMGVWRLLDFGTEINPVHAALLRTGDVLLFSGSGNDLDRFNAHEFRSRVWHYPAARLDAPHTPIDLFCAGQAFLPDGRLLAAGGTRLYDNPPPFKGLTDAQIFDPVTNQWTAAPHMAHGRWYPSLLALADGDMLAVSGLGVHGPLTEIPERFDSAGSGWSALPSPGPIPMYPHLFLLADGRIFYSGGHYGETYHMLPLLWELGTGHTTTVHGLDRADFRNQAASVLLPPAQAQQVMILGGGGFATHHGPAPALADTRIVDLDAPAVHYRPGAPMHHARMHLCAVLLPDRTVLAAGGSAMEETAQTAPPYGEIYHPGSDTWTTTGPSRIPRLYHSIALLMPDGKVITAGSNPVRKAEELRIEVYWPPYLFHERRPTLDLAASAGSYGDTVAATVDDPATLDTVSLIRPGASTHSSDTEQRLVDVPFTVGSGTSVTLQLPTDPTLAPPGWYLVFAVDTHGVPSEGAWFQLT